MSATHEAEAGAAASQPAYGHDDEPDESHGAPSGRDLRRGIIGLLAASAVVVVVLLALPGLSAVRGHLAHGMPGWLVLAGCFRVMSALAFVVVFAAVLAPSMSRRLSYRIGMSEIGVNALVPAGGTAGLAVGGWALHRLGTPTGEVVKRTTTLFVFTSAFNVGAVAVLGWLGAIGVLSVAHGGGALALTVVPALLATAVILLALAIAPRLASLQALQAKHRRHSLSWWLLGVGVILGTGAKGAIDLFRERNPLAIAGGAGYLLFDIATLWATVQAFHGRAPAGSLAMAYLIGQLGGEIPVPGGIGVVGGGLIGALTVYALPISLATASILAYRAIALAIPILFGGLAMIFLTRTLRGLSGATASAQHKDDSKAST
jgi:uncharacterized membrane protein YbhN (UPF0104 family)